MDDMQDNNYHLEEISIEKLIPKDVQNFVNKIIQKEKYVHFETKVRVIASEYNFSSQLYDVKLRAEVLDNKDQETHLFIKSLKTNIFSNFDTELFVYKELFEIYTELQENANIIPDHRFKTVKFYDVSDTTTIVLENLRKSGYEEFDRTERITLSFAVSAVKQLAMFHALSFVIKKRNPIYFERKLINLNFLLTSKDVWKFWKHVAYSLAKASTEHVENTDTKKKLEDFICEQFIQSYQRHYVYPDSQYACLCHGDYRPENIMIKKDNNEGQLIVVDFQTVYYNYPVNDLIYFIFCKSDSEFRRRHMDEIKDIYYQSLDDFLQNFDVDVESVYPRAEFEKQFKDRVDHGLVTGLMLNLLAFADQKSLLDFYEALEITDLDNPIESPLHIDLQRGGVEMIQDLVNDFAQMGFL